MKKNKGFYEKSRSLLAEFLLNIGKSDLENVLDDLLTPQEISELAERILLLKNLKQGKTQREIAQEMGISITTVNRGSRILQYGTGAVSQYL